jgi:hypothetical protein
MEDRPPVVLRLEVSFTIYFGDISQYLYSHCIALHWRSTQRTSWVTRDAILDEAFVSEIGVLFDLHCWMYIRMASKAAAPAISWSVAWGDCSLYTLRCQSDKFDNRIPVLRWTSLSKPPKKKKRLNCYVLMFSDRAWIQSTTILPSSVKGSNSLWIVISSGGLCSIIFHCWPGRLISRVARTMLLPWLPLLDYINSVVLVELIG